MVREERVLQQWRTVLLASEWGKIDLSKCTASRGHRQGLAICEATDMPKEIPYRVLAVCTVTLTTLCGYVSGRIHQGVMDIPVAPLEIVQDTRPKIPVVTIDEIREGMIRGTASGHVRVFGEGHMVIPSPTGDFAIALADLRATVEIRIPPNAKYAASKNGKKYYDINSKAAARLKPETRVYFGSAEEAEKAGYRK